MDHEKLWVALKAMDMPQHLIALICSLHCAQEATVRTEHVGTEWVPTGKGVRTGAFCLSILSPCMFVLSLWTLFCEPSTWI